MDEGRLEWCGSSYRDLLEMPASVQRTFGYALGLAQNGMRYDGTKILKGFRPALVEILEDDDGDTYRAIYTAHFEDSVYVLHCFKKKSTRGRNLPKGDRQTIERRLAEVRRIETERSKARKRS